MLTTRHSNISKGTHIKEKENLCNMQTNLLKIKRNIPNETYIREHFSLDFTAELKHFIIICTQQECICRYFSHIFTFKFPISVAASTGLLACFFSIRVVCIKKGTSNMHAILQFNFLFFRIFFL